MAPLSESSLSVPRKVTTDGRDRSHQYHCQYDWLFLIGAILNFVWAKNIKPAFRQHVCLQIPCFCLGPSPVDATLKGLVIRIFINCRKFTICGIYYNSDLGDGTGSTGLDNRRWVLLSSLRSWCSWREEKGNSDRMPHAKPQRAQRCGSTICCYKFSNHQEHGVHGDLNRKPQ